jgi:hypothetical protein
MPLRGVQAVGSGTITSTLLGTLREDDRSRAEFLSLRDLTHDYRPRLAPTPVGGGFPSGNERRSAAKELSSVALCT